MNVFNTKSNWQIGFDRIYSLFTLIYYLQTGVPKHAGLF